MSQSLQDIPSQTFNSSTTSNSAGVDGSSRTCRVGAIEVQDCYSPSSPTALPSPSEMRAFRAGVGETTGSRGTDLSKGQLRFHTSVWDAFGSKVSYASARPKPVSAASGPKTTRSSSGFNHELWYAQSAAQELQQKKEQLSFNAIRTRRQAVASGE